nr:P-loop NTPase fold protein [Acinetobacter defluvii]
MNWQRTNLDHIEQAWEGDLWDRKRLGEQLTRYVDRLNCGAVLALDARWGEGKTWFVRHWKKHLEEEQHNVIYLDAFANDYLEDPFLVISSEITSCLSKDDDVDQNHIDNFKEKAATAYQALLPSLPKVLLTLGLNLISGGVLGTLAQQVHESGEKVIESATDVLGDKIKESIEAKIENHEADKNTLQAFKQELAQLADELDKPLVFIVDELDRCRPDFAIRLIERIKHFFDIPKIVFVLVMDKTQFSKVVCHNYGYDEKLGEEYLDKFVDFSVKLKYENLDYLKQKDEIKTLFNLLGFQGEKEINAYVEDIGMYVKYKKTSIREIKKNINLFALLYQNQTIKSSLILFSIFFKSELMNVESNDEMVQLLVSPINADPKFNVNLDLFNNQFTHHQITSEMNSLGNYSILYFVFGILNRRFTQEKSYDFLDQNYDFCPLHLTSKKKVLSSLERICRKSYLSRYMAGCE